MNYIYRFNSLIQQRVAVTPIDAYEKALVGDREWLKNSNLRAAIAHASPTLSEELADEPIKSKVIEAAFRYLNRSANRMTPFGLFVAHRPFVNDQVIGTSGSSSVVPLSTSNILFSRWAEQPDERAVDFEQRIVGLNPTVRRQGRYYVWQQLSDRKEGTVRRVQLRITEILDFLYETLADGRMESCSDVVNKIVLRTDRETEAVSGYVDTLLRHSFLQADHDARDFFNGAQIYRDDIFSSDNEVARIWVNQTVDYEERSSDTLGFIQSRSIPGFLDLHLSEESEMHLGSGEIEEITRAVNTVLVTSSVKPEISMLIEGWMSKFVERYGLEVPVLLLDAIDPHDGIGPVEGYQYPATLHSGPSESRRVWDDDSLSLRLALYCRASRLGRSEYVDLASPEFRERLEAIRDRFGDQDLYPDFDLSLSVSEVGGEKYFLCRSDALALGGHTFTRTREIMNAETRQLWMKVLGNLATDSGGKRVDLLSYPIRASLDFQVPYPEEGQAFTSTEARDGAVPLRSLWIWAAEEGLRVGLRDDEGAIHAIITNFPTLVIPLAFRNEARLLVDVSRAPYRLAAGFSWAQLEGADWLPEVRYGRVVLRPAEWRISGAMRLAAREARKERDVSGLRELLATEGVRGDAFYATGDNRLHFDTSNDFSLMMLARLISRAADGDRIEKSSIDEHRGVTYAVAGNRQRHSTELILSFSRSCAARPMDECPIGADGSPTSVMGRDWMTLVLSSEPRCLDELVTAAAQVSEVLMSRREIDSWHFVRYNDEGCSLRLRWHVSSSDSEIWQQALRFVESCENELTVRAWGVRPYIPETGKYGDEGALDRAHEAFMHSSRQAVALIEERPGLTDAECLVNEFRSFLQYAVYLGCDQLSLLQVLPRVDHPTRATREVWRSERTLFLHIAHDVLASEARVEDLETKGAIQAKERANSSCLGETAISNLLHMHSNRMCSSGDRYEANLYWLARKSIEGMVR